MKLKLRTSTTSYKRRNIDGSRALNFVIGNNFIKPGRWKATCSNCMQKRSIVHVFMLSNGKFLVQECASCRPDIF